jgi:hypothetical protein
VLEQPDKSQKGEEMQRTRVTLLLATLLCANVLRGQTVTSFEGIDASQVTHPFFDVDPNGAVGTKQYMEWTNVYFQAYDKVTFAPVWSTPQSGVEPWVINNMQQCTTVTGDGIINFDRQASRWVIGVRTQKVSGDYYYCVAISNTDDLTSATLGWYTYAFLLNPVLGTNSYGHTYFPDWPKLGSWADAYYASFDLNDVDNNYQEIGVVVCALDRTNMLIGATPNPMQCFSDPNPIPQNGTLYLRHSLIPADIEGTTAPPSGRDEFLVSIQNPPADGYSTTSNVINLWDFHVDWANPVNSTFTNSPLTVPSYTPGCYDVSNPALTQCIPEPSTKRTHNHVDSVGDRLMPRLAYRNFGTYESFLVSHTVQTSTTTTGIRWYELRGSGTPAVYQSGTIWTKYADRFMPSIAQDQSGHAAVGYNISSSATLHPGIRASTWNLNRQKSPVEVNILTGTGDEENSWHWGDYSSMTVDPVDGCSFWYVTQYFAQNQWGKLIDWDTRIANFRLLTCSGRK